MSYLLNRLEILVSNVSKPNVCLIRQVNVQHHANEIENIYLSIKKKLLQKSAKQQSRKKLSNLICFYQASLIRLADELMTKQCPCCHQQNCRNTHLLPLINKLTDILVFINEQFNDFFDNNQKLPLVCYHKHKERIRDRSTKIAMLLEEQVISHPMASILLHPFNDFINQKKSDYTFYDKRFLYGWLERLESLHLMNYGIDKSCEVLCKNLIAYDLNSEECIDFFALYITDKYKAEETKAEQLQTLNHFLKCIQQTTIVNDKGYNPDKPSLQCVLANWVNEEISYIKKSCHINQRAYNKPLTKDHINKIKTNLSVSKLACFLRVCAETDIFPEENNRELIKHFSDYFSTRKTDSISFDSLYNKFYSPDKSAIEEVKNTVLKQLKILQENLF